MRNIKGRPPRTINILNEDGQLYRRNDEIANRLGQSFKQVSSTTNYQDNFVAFKRNAEEHTLEFSTSTRHVYNKTFTREKFYTLLSKTSSTSPGPDNIHYNMIKNLPDSAKTHLIRIFNMLFNSSHYPEQCKHAIVIP